MNSITLRNLNKICRVCLVECEQMFSIYSKLYEDQSDLNAVVPCICEILSSISSMKVRSDDGLPSLICNKCVDMAHTSFKLQKQCNRSQVILDSYLKQSGSVKIGVVKDLSTLEEINKNGLIQNTGGSIGASDFLLTENETEDTCLPVKAAIEDVDSTKAEDVLAKCLVEFVDPVDLPNNGLAFQKNKAINGDEDCEFSIKSKTVTKRYDKGKHNKIYTCSVCNKTYKYSNSLRIHMRNHTQERPYVCKTCGKGFKQYGSLVYHIRSHTGEKPYSCKLCDKKYKQSGTLTAHMRIHTGVRPFLCSICGRGFRQAPDLGYHMRSHTKEKPYMCSVCGKTMSMQSHLVQHMRIHTGERPYKCRTCEKAFPSSTRLKRHEIVHTDLKPYTCDVCSKSFNRMSSLKVHGKIHTDERSHICPICNKRFIQAHALKSHLVSHSSDITMKPTSAQYLI